MLAFARRTTGGAEAAEDVAQQALLRVFERCSEFDPERGRALPWILGVTAWQVRTWKRQQQRSREVTGTDEQPVCPDTPELELERAQLVAALGEAPGQLRPGDTDTLLAGGMAFSMPLVSRGLGLVSVGCGLTWSCVGSCLLGGLAAGWWLDRVCTRDPERLAWSLLLAGSVTALTCAPLGLAAVVVSVGAAATIPLTRSATTLWAK